MQLMQQTSLLDRAITPAGTLNVWRHPGYTLNVALVYLDPVTRLWARQVRDLMANLVGEEAVRCTEWKIGDLKEPRVYTQGAAALARADVIVIAVYEADRFPAEFYLWVNLWLLQRTQSSGALVALVGTPGEMPYGSNETQRYLRALARQGRLELFLKECSRASATTGTAWADLTHWAKAAKAA